ncbi:MAG: hypothetical protein ACI9WS_001688 [Paraglaciecola psychrophila]|jgi:uncharacterized protein YggL (DUF469 family)
MSKVSNRSKRLRKKLYQGEFTVLGFDFSCKINLDSASDYELFFDQFADFVDTENLFVSLDANEEQFEGFVTSGDRYSNATEEHRKAVEKALSSYAIVTDVNVSELVNAHYAS